MNWLSTSKKLSTRPAPADGYCPIAEARELDVYFLRLASLEQKVKTMSKEVKTYNESLLKLVEQEAKLASHLVEVPLNSGYQNQKLYLSLDGVNKQIDANANAVVEINKKCAIEPLNRFRNEFSNLQHEFTKRDQLLKRCQEAKSEVEKLSKKDRTGTNYIKLEQAKRNYQQIQASFCACNSRLLKETKEFYDLRVDFFNPSLAALLHSQVDFYGESMKLYKELPISCKVGFESEIQSEISASMKLIRNLAIAGGQQSRDSLLPDQS